MITIAEVNRGNEFTATFGMDPAQLDRFAPLQIYYMPAEEEVKLLQSRHPELSATRVRLIVEIADRVRKSPELSTGLSVRATEEACIYLKHPLMERHPDQMLEEVLMSSFCGRFPGRWSDVTTGAGAVWSIIQTVLREKKKA